MFTMTLPLDAVDHMAALSLTGGREKSSPLTPLEELQLEVYKILLSREGTA